MEFLRTELHNLACFNVKGTKDDVFSLAFESEKQVFEDGLYKNGPTMVSISRSQFRSPEKQELSVFIPVNMAIEASDNFTFLKYFQMEKTVMKRLSLQDNLNDSLKEMETFTREHGFHLTEDKLYMTFYPVYGEYWVDLQMMVEED